MAAFGVTAEGLESCRKSCVGRADYNSCSTGCYQKYDRETPQEKTFTQQMSAADQEARVIGAELANRVKAASEGSVYKASDRDAYLAEYACPFGK